MAAYVFKDAQALYAGRDVSGILNSVSISFTNDLQEDTTIGDGTRSRKSGLVTSEISLDGFWDVGTDSDIFSDVGGTGEVFTVLPAANTVGSRCFFMKGIQESYEQSDEIGSLRPFNLVMQSNDPLIRGRSIAEETAATVDGSSSNLIFPALASGERMFAVLHVLAVSGTNPTLDVVLKSDDDGTFGVGDTTRITFTQATAAGAEVLSVSGPITDQYWRAEWTVSDDSAGSPSFSFLVALGITDK